MYVQVTPDGRTVYYEALTSLDLHSIDAEFLRDFSLSQDELSGRALDCVFVPLIRPLFPAL